MAQAVTVAEAKPFLRVAHDGEDGLITTLLEAAQARVERETGLVLSAASPAPLRLAVMMLAAQAYEGRGAAAEDAAGPWLRAWRRARL
jgi:hypothetical protein